MPKQFLSNEVQKGKKDALDKQQSQRKQEIENQTKYYINSLLKEIIHISAIPSLKDCEEILVIATKEAFGQNKSIAQATIPTTSNPVYMEIIQNPTNYASYLLQQWEKETSVKKGAKTNNLNTPVLELPFEDLKTGKLDTKSAYVTQSPANCHENVIPSISVDYFEDLCAKKLSLDKNSSNQQDIASTCDIFEEIFQFFAFRSGTETTTNELKLFHVFASAILSKLNILFENFDFESLFSEETDENIENESKIVEILQILLFLEQFFDNYLIRKKKFQDILFSSAQDTQKSNYSSNKNTMHDLSLALEDLFTVYITLFAKMTKFCASNSEKSEKSEKKITFKLKNSKLNKKFKKLVGPKKLRLLEKQKPEKLFFIYVNLFLDLNSNKKTPKKLGNLESNKKILTILKEIFQIQNQKPLKIIETQLESLEKPEKQENETIENIEAEEKEEKEENDSKMEEEEEEEEGIAPVEEEEEEEEEKDD